MTTTLDADRENHQDTGCEESPSCLNCPFPRCKYDDPAWFRRYQLLERDRDVWETMEEEGLPVTEAAERFSVSVRTIFRIKARRLQERAT